MTNNMPTLKELNDLRDEAYENAKSHGFHDEDHSKEHYLCLVLTELMESVEADRKARYCAFDLNEVDLIEDDADYIAIFEQNVKDTVEDEIADTAIRLFDYAGLYSCDMSPFKDYQVLDIYYEKDPLKHTATSFTEVAFDIAKDIMNYETIYALYELFAWAYIIGFDLTTHIKLKMRYNSYRERMHGKRY